MRLTVRRRVMLVVLIAGVAGFFYIAWGAETAENIIRHYVDGGVSCSGTWRDLGNAACGGGTGNYDGTYDVALAFVELLGVSAIVLVLGWLLARWTLRPTFAMAELVVQLGPTSLGLRLRADGPRDEMRRLSDALDAMLDRVSDGYEAQRRFAANASHELRTPLATQRTLIEVSLNDGQLTPDQVDLLSRQLLMTNERNEKLIEGLLVLAETERGLVTVGPQRLDAIVSEAVEMMQPAAERAGLRLSAELDEPVVVKGEQLLLERLVLNLVSNAIKYNTGDGWVRVGVEPTGLLTVSNSGPIIPDERVPTLFEPFTRQNGGRLGHDGGAGLGLTIVRSIVAAHEGSIQAHARAEGGLNVEVRLAAA